MPNHVINHVRVSGENAAVLMKKYFTTDKKTGVEEFDFEIIIPTPEGADPYKFHCDNWDTKWNAYNQNITTYTEFSFQTAWSTPIKIFEKLSKLEPRLTFDITFADEDIGHNCGSYSLHNGLDIEQHIFPDYSIRSKQFAKTCWGEDESEDDDDL